MLFFSKDHDGTTVNQARGGYIILLVGAICSAFAIQFIYVLVGIFVLTVLSILFILSIK